MIDGAGPGIGCRDAVADQPLVQLQVRKLTLLDSWAGVPDEHGEPAGFTGVLA